MTRITIVVIPISGSSNRLERQRPRLHELVNAKLQPGRLRSSRYVKPRNRVLMFIVRKLDRELAFVFCLRLLRRVIRFAEREARIFARRGAHVTHSADDGARSNHRLPSEELLTMTAHTSFVIGKISDVRKVSFGSPTGRNLVTLVAAETFVLLGRVQKTGVLRRRRAWRLRLRRGW